MYPVLLYCVTFRVNVSNNSFVNVFYREKKLEQCMYKYLLFQSKYYKIGNNFIYSCLKHLVSFGSMFHLFSKRGTATNE